MTTATDFLTSALKTLEKCKSLLERDEDLLAVPIDGAISEVQCAKELLQEAARNIGGLT